MIRATLFDLDSCLCAADEVGRDLFATVFEAISSANDGALSPEELAQSFEACWRFPFDDVARRWRYTEPMRAAGMREFARVEVRTPMRGYGDLRALRTIPRHRYLVTTGFPRLQCSKIEALGIGDIFEAIHIDTVNEPTRSGKEAIFRSIAAGRFETDEVLVVGDNPDSEIAAGRRLGFVTAQMLRPGVERGHNADHFVHDLFELRALIEALSDRR